MRIHLIISHMSIFELKFQSFVECRKLENLLYLRSTAAIGRCNSSLAEQRGLESLVSRLPSRQRLEMMGHSSVELEAFKETTGKILSRMKMSDSLSASSSASLAEKLTASSAATAERLATMRQSAGKYLAPLAPLAASAVSSAGSAASYVRTAASRIAASANGGNSVGENADESAVELGEDGVNISSSSSGGGGGSKVKKKRVYVDVEEVIKPIADDSSRKAFESKLIAELSAAAGVPTRNFVIEEVRAVPTFVCALVCMRERVCEGLSM